MSVTHEHAQAVDTRLAELWGKLAEGRLNLQRQIDDMHWAMKERPIYRTRTRREWPTSTAEVEAAFRAKVAEGSWPAYEAQQRLGQIGRLSETRDGIRRLEELAAPLQAEFEAERWPRFFWVTNTGGHIHSSMRCSTCHPTTLFAWLPEVSGLTEADAVALKGPRLCSVCFPSAPIEWTLGSPKAARCAGSGQIVPPIKTYSRYGRCPVCGDSYARSNVGAIRAHKPKETK